MKSVKNNREAGPLNVRLWSSLLGYLGEFRGKIIFLMVVMLAVAAIDLSFPLMTKYAVDNFVTPRSLDGITGFSAVFAVLGVLQAVNVYLLIHLAGELEMGMVYRLRQRGFERLQQLSFDYFDTTASGWLLTRMTSDCQRLGEVIAWGIQDIVWGMTFMVGIAAIMMALNFRLALAVLVVVPLLAWASYFFQRKILKSQRLVRRSNSRISAGYAEGIHGGPTVKVLARENESAQEFGHLTGRMNRASVISARFSALYLPVILFLGSVGTALVLSYGGFLVQARLIGFGTLMAFISYTLQFFDPLHEIARVVSEMQSARAAGERVLSMIETPLTILDAADVEARFGTVIAPKPQFWPKIHGEVRFESVGFRYSGGQRVLENFSLSVPAGQTIALTGATGSGKTTIVNLICRFYEPSEGHIMIDGIDYRNIGLATLRGNLGYVLQSPQLFNISIRENIRYGRLDASDAEVEQAARAANAHQFIVDMDEGYESLVGEGGNHLSTGQKQLISIARAILADPAIIVLDEATSSVDPETEALIQDAVQTVLSGRTSFVIAHRLSTIRSADRILVIEKGNIIEDGNHEQLIAMDGQYADMHRQQFIEEEEFKVLGRKED